MMMANPVAIPCVTYRFVELRAEQRALKGANYATYTHKLLSIDTTTRTIELPVDCIERNTLTGSDLAQIQLFNEVYIPESNTKSIQLVFHDLDGSVYTCTPTMRGTLSIADADEGPLVVVRTAEEEESRVYPEQDGDGDVFFAASTYTMVHYYAETNAGRCFHVGISFLPIGPIFIPLWMCGTRLARILADWRGPKLDAAKRESLLVVRGLSGSHSIRHVLSRAHEKHDCMALPP